jgi:type II secretory pathway pseudopilin PulG
MSNPSVNARRRRGITLIETLVATSAMAIMGVIVFYLLNAGVILFAKNTAVNVAHQQARVAVLTMEQDLHSAISIPQLVDANRNPLPSGSTLPAAGISFQMFSEGPFEVVAAANALQNQIKVNSQGYKPKVGQRFNLPLHQVELEITGVSGMGSNNCVLTLASPLPRPIDTSLDDAGTLVPVIVTGFTSERYTYLVKNGELRYFRPGDSVGRVLATDITSPTPFSVPATPLGAPYNRFVAAINLSTADHTTSNRGFKSANMFLNAMVPYRAKLCYYQ